MIDLTKGERAELATRSRDYTLPTERLYERKSSCWRARGLATIASQPASTCRARSSASGVGASISSGLLVLTNGRAAGDRPAFPPSVAVAIKALAGELPCRQGLPLSRWSVAELRQEAVARGIVAQISGTTL